MVGLTSTAEVANPLMLPLIKRIRWEIEQRLLEGTSAADRGLLEEFLQARRQASGPLVAVSQQAMHTNAAAAAAVALADRAVLWNWASPALARQPYADSELRLSSGSPLTARARPVRDGPVLAGALVRLDQPGTAQPTATKPGQPNASRPAFRKLGVTSRVELTRLVVERKEAGRGAAR